MITLDASFLIGNQCPEINTYFLSDIDHMYCKQNMNESYCMKSKLILLLTS